MPGRSSRTLLSLSVGLLAALPLTAQAAVRPSRAPRAMELARHGERTQAPAAAQARLRLAFDGLRLHRVVARSDGRNDASVAVMERLGMRQEAHFVENEFVKGEWTDEIVYAMLEDEWRTKR